MVYLNARGSPSMHLDICILFLFFLPVLLGCNWHTYCVSFRYIASCFDLPISWNDDHGQLSDGYNSCIWGSIIIVLIKFNLSQIILRFSFSCCCLIISLLFVFCLVPCGQIFMQLIILLINQSTLLIFWYFINNMKIPELYIMS